MSKESNLLSRREFLKRSAQVGTISLVGLSTFPGLVKGNQKEFSGITIDYWNQFNVQNRLAKLESERIVKDFEERTGAKVNITWNGYADIIGPKYRSSFKAGVKPTVFDSVVDWTGEIRKYLLPLNDFMDELDVQTRKSIKWEEEIAKDVNRGWPNPEKRISIAALGIIVQDPFVTRTDHWEQAGMDFEKNFPPKSIDHLVEICKEFQNAGVTKYPYQIYGSTFDAGDETLPAWVVAKDREKGTFLNEDCTDTNVDSDVWLETIQEWVNLYRKHHIVSDRAPVADDETAAEQLALGKKSIITASFLDRGLIMDRAPELMKKGVIQYGTNMDLGSGSIGNIYPWTFHIVKQEGPDAEVKERVAWELIKEFLKKENSVAVARTIGAAPLRKDAWEELMGQPDRFMEVEKAMLETKPRAWSSHPLQLDAQFNRFGPHMSNALRGKDVEAERDAYVKEMRERFEKFDIKDYL